MGNMLTITWKSSNKKKPDWKVPDRVFYNHPYMKNFFIGAGNQNNGVDVEVTYDMMKKFLRSLNENEDNFNADDYDEMESYAYLQVHSYKWNQWKLCINCKW